MPGQCTRSRAEGDGRSDTNQCCDMKADLATIGPEATLKARRCVGPTRKILLGTKHNALNHSEINHAWFGVMTVAPFFALRRARHVAKKMSSRMCPLKLSIPTRVLIIHKLATSQVSSLHRGVRRGRIGDLWTCLTCNTRARPEFPRCPDRSLPSTSTDRRWKRTWSSTGSILSTQGSMIYIIDGRATSSTGRATSRLLRRRWSMAPP